jgi:hypothetical protein
MSGKAERCGAADSHNIPLLIRICTPYDEDSHHQHPMPSWPAGQGRSVINLALKVELIAHLDQMADLYGCSRAAYVRQLVVSPTLTSHAQPAAAPIATAGTRTMALAGGSAMAAAARTTWVAAATAWTC